MIDRIFAATVRWLGGDVERVFLLRDWMERAAKGRIQLEIEKRQGSMMPIDPRGMRIFIGMALVFMSMLIAGVTVVGRGIFGIWYLTMTAVMVVVGLILLQAVQRLLPDDDVKVMGGWPVSIREVMLARVGLLLEPALQVTVLLSALPLLVLLVVGRPPVLASLLLACGLLLQTVGLVVAAVLVAATLRRIGGQRQAERLFILVYGLIVGLPWLPAFVLMPREDDAVITSWLAAPPWYVVVLPPGWTASWGLVFTSRFAWIGAALGFLVTAAMGALVVRGVISGGRGEVISPMRGLRRRLPVVPVIEILLAPSVRGREGWVMRRLTASHLRDDTQTLQMLAAIPVLIVLEGAFFFDRSWIAALAEPAETVPVRIAFFFTLPAMLFPMIAMLALVYSGEARAAWVLASAELHPHRMLAAQRGVARGLTLIPMLLVFAALHLYAGTAPALVISDLALVWLVWETACAVVQSFYPVMPFSRPRDDLGTEIVPVFVLMMPTWILLAIWIVLGYELLPWWAGKVGTWLFFGWLILYLRRRLERKVGSRGLPVEFAPPAKGS